PSSPLVRIRAGFDRIHPISKTASTDVAEAAPPTEGARLPVIKVNVGAVPVMSKNGWQRIAIANPVLKLAPEHRDVVRDASDRRYARRRQQRCHSIQAALTCIVEQGGKLRP